MHRGYDIWRESVGGLAWADEAVWKVWSWCLWKAAEEEMVVAVKVGKGKTLVKLKPGQLVFQRGAAAEELEMPESTVRNRLARLVEMGAVDRQPDNQKTLLTIVGWATCDADTKKSGRESGQPKDNQRTTKGQPNSSGYTEEFERFWEVFPRGRRKSKGKAFEAWQKALKVAGPEEIIGRAVDYAHSAEGNGDWVKMPSTWLNQRCWEDDDAAWAPKGLTNEREQRSLFAVDQWLDAGK